MRDLPRHFRLMRDVDSSGISGTGHVADGVVFSDGEAAVHWLGRWPTTTPHPEGITSVEGIHGHGGATRIVFLDEDNEMREEIKNLRAQVARLTLKLQGWHCFASDLDRCEHGRHPEDACYGCPDGNRGNTLLTEGQVIGHTVHGHEIVVPPVEERKDARAWRRR